MNIQPFVMPAKAAREAFLQYRDAFRQTGSKEDEALMRGYKEIAAGASVISLPQVIQAGGMDENGYPNLAIARATQKQVRVSFSSPLWRWREMQGQFHFFDPEHPAAKPFFFPQGTLPVWEKKDAKGFYLVRHDATTIVPNIPPALRPPYALSGYHLLWEVEEWKVIAPKDPALLKHLGGELYAVLAVWDLTDLERAVIGQTRRSLPG